MVNQRTQRSHANNSTKPVTMRLSTSFLSLAVLAIMPGGLANLPTRQAFDNGLEQRQLQVPAGSFEGSKGPRSLQPGCRSFDADWKLVVHMSNISNMFDGDSNFDPACNCTTNPFVAELNATTADFYRPFPIATANVGQIKFSAGGRWLRIGHC
jgi:hypothetical protein